jgi:isoleucyl-tRNA synthetase
VLATALFDRPAFRNVISHGIVLGSDGQKMSKSLRNYPDVNEVFERDGSDAMRWFLMSSPVLRGGNLVVTEEGIREGVRQLLLPLWSTWYFFSLYANAAGTQGAGGGAGYDATWRADSTDVLDRYILSKTRELVESVTEDLEGLDSTLAAARLRDFADVLTNWYVRRSRERFWAGVDADGNGREAFDTLYTVLETVTRVAAPLLPLVSERIWKDLTGGESVHLTDWPDAASFPVDPALVRTMDTIRLISSSALSLRKQAGLRVRLPLAGLTVVAPRSAELAEFEGILRDELNVKEVRFVELEESSATTFGVTRRLTVNARAAGPRLGRDVQRVIQGARSGDWSEDGDVVTVAGVPLVDGEYELVLETSSSAGDHGTALALLPGGGFILLDTFVTDALRDEGLARDLIRAVQDARKAAGFQVSDRINLGLVFFDEEDARAVQRAHAVDVAAETLATVYDVVGPDGGSQLDRRAEQAPVEWLSAVLGWDATFFQDVAAGKFATSGRFIVAVRRADGSIDV